MLWKKSQRKFRESEVEVAFGGLVKDLLGEGGGGFGGSGPDGPENDIQLWRRGGGEEEGRFFQKSMEFKGGSVTGFEALREGAGGRVWKQLLRSPESDRGGSGTGALEGDLSEMKIIGREIGIGRVVFVKPADGGVAEEDAPAAVRLETVLVRVDDDGVGVWDGVEGGASLGGEIGGEGEVSAVGGVDVDAEFVSLL
jgi:hypothetical protein